MMFFHERIVYTKSTLYSQLNSLLFLLLVEFNRRFTVQLEIQRYSCDILAHPNLSHQSHATAI
jgi:hypothetical protein